MSQSTVLLILRTKPFMIVMTLMLLVVLIKAILSSLDLHETFAGKGNDDIMRLLSVRDWLAGQGWYDVAQYRAVPPDGVSLHWSRYIDVGIAAIIWPLSFFFAMETAEVLASVIWPTLIMVVNVVVIGFGTRRIFGTWAACFAVGCTVLWPVTGDLHSGSGNLDHHNVQMLTMTLMALSVIWPSRSITAGFIGGFSAAFSLAIGLETLPFVIGTGFVVLIRATSSKTPQVRRLLVAFCLTMGVGSVLLWLGQAAPSTRLNPICDQLGTPTLALIWIAVTATISPLAIGLLARSMVVHLTATIILTALGLFAAWALVSPCLEGPYATLPLPLQDFISGSITEAKPGLNYAQNLPLAFVSFTLPVFVTGLSGIVLWMLNRQGKILSQLENTALAGLVFLCLAGFAMIFFQMRTVIMAASIVPILAGYVLAQLLQGYLTHRNSVRGLLILVVGIAVMSPSLFAPIFKHFIPERGSSALAQTAECRTYEALVALNEAPPGLILNHFNFGPSLLWATHHDVLSVGYHRSAAGMSNSIIPFELEASKMEAYVKASGATYLLLCRGYNYRGEQARALADGGTVDWLQQVHLPHDDQLLFEVLR